MRRSRSHTRSGKANRAGRSRAPAFAKISLRISRSRRASSALTTLLFPPSELLDWRRGALLAPASPGREFGADFEVDALAAASLGPVVLTVFVRVAPGVEYAARVGFAWGALAHDLVPHASPPKNRPAASITVSWRARHLYSLVATLTSYRGVLEYLSFIMPSTGCGCTSRRLHVQCLRYPGDDITLAFADPLAAETQEAAFLGRLGGSIGEFDKRTRGRRPGHPPRL